ncbi:MAG: M20 family peptidase, partial [Phascolarctobacterium sp.]
MEKITFDHEEALALLKLMISTNTVNGNEIVLERKLKEILEKEGLECEIDEFGPNGRANMVVKYPGLDHSKPVLAMTGHMDTVPVGQVQWEHE